MALKENRLDRGIRLFDNPILDFMSRVHPLLPVSFWLPVAVVFSVYAVGYAEVPLPWLNLLWLIPAGYVVWCFSEYWIHRWFFHFQPKAKWLKQMFYYVHEHHHRYQEKDRLLAPPLMSLPIFFAYCGIFYGAVGTWAGLAPACAMMTGFIIGYLIYDYIHLYTHFAKPKTQLGKMFRRLHLQHHFARPDRWYGISCPWVDYLFGTYSRKGEKSLNSKDNRGAEVHYFGDDELPPKVQEYERLHGGQPGKEWKDAPEEKEKENAVVAEPQVTA
ncbi:MAG: sterol desaturase family protein [Planctomycetota bacterium]